RRATSWTHLVQRPSTTDESTRPSGYLTHNQGALIIAPPYKIPAKIVLIWSENSSDARMMHEKQHLSA
ncbi:MAG: hypothetical protein VX068_02500, partial [Candidatus Thermoplasmatota archaeon]|nr:hypothetical protein [Candidatus Thermoplasmatota archaeon]